jgi:aspartyl-tRNA synthetase
MCCIFQKLNAKKEKKAKLKHKYIELKNEMQKNKLKFKNSIVLASPTV